MTKNKTAGVKIIMMILQMALLVCGIFALPVYAEPEDAVCSIGDQYYTSIEEAIDEAQIGDTIKLLTDIDQSATIAISGKTFTLDGGGYTIKASGTGYSLVSISSSSNITLKDITLDGNRNGSTVLLNHASKLFIEDGAIIENGTSTDDYYAGGLVNRGGGTVTMNGGEIRNNSGSGSGGYITSLRPSS